jgi:hypothetical protein
VSLIIRFLLILILENYGKVRDDCNQAIKLDAKMIKPYYRKAFAEFMLGKYKDGLAAIK